MFGLMVAGQERFHVETLNSSMPEKWDAMCALFRMFAPSYWKDDDHVPNTLLATLGIEPGESDADAFRRIFGELPSGPRHQSLPGGYL
jgi:hypothetical protein